MLGAQVPSLVQKLRSRKPWGVAKKNFFLTEKQNKKTHTESFNILLDFFILCRLIFSNSTLFWEKPRKILQWIFKGFCEHSLKIAQESPYLSVDFRVGIRSYSATVPNSLMGWRGGQPVCQECAWLIKHTEGASPGLRQTRLWISVLCGLGSLERKCSSVG